MSDLRSNEELFFRIMQKSRLNMPYRDFEDNVMRRIEAEIAVKKAISRNTKLSILFFLLGAAFGLLIGDFLSQSISIVFNIPKEQTLLFFQGGYLLFFLIQLDSILRLFKNSPDP